MRLTAVAAKNAKPREKAYKIFDGDGFYLLVHPKGGKYWQLKYRFLDKEKTFSLGPFPEVSLVEARDLASQARRDVRNGIDPSYEKKAAKKRAKAESENSFRSVSEEWHAMRKDIWTPRHATKVWTRLEQDVFHDLGARPICQITPAELLSVLRKMETRGVTYTAHRTQQIVGQIYRFAIACGKVERDITSDLRGALKASKAKNYARLSQNELPEFLGKIANYDGERQTQNALMLLMLTFVRTQELRAAKWSEFDFERSEWRIPAERMKMRLPHVVPLSQQAKALFLQQRVISRTSEYVFPNRNRPASYMSENTIIYGIYRMGYHSRTTAHGFRGTASTILHEEGFGSEIIERQLAHRDRNAVRASYNHADYLQARREMMQWWGDYIERAGGWKQAESKMILGACISPA